MRFGSGTTVNGKIHSNKGIRFDGLATNVVSSSLTSYDDPDHTESPTKLEFGVHTHVISGTVVDSYRPNEVPPHSVDSRTDVFQAGRQFPVAQMDFTSVVSDISYMRTQAIAIGTKFDNSGVGRKIILKTDGKFDIYKVSTYDASANAITGFAGKKNSNGSGSDCTTPVNTVGSDVQCKDKTGSSSCYCPRSSWTGDLKLTYDIPDNGVIFVANNIWLGGIINTKKVSIVAAELSDESGYSGVTKNVYLGMDNLLYTNTDGSDIIGIIAQKDVEIVRDSLTNLTIDGALLAKDGRVGRSYYNGITKNSITVNGSMATNQRYGFAYTDGTGYITRNLNFDNNLLYYPPPYFPTGTEYSIDQWDEL